METIIPIGKDMGFLEASEAVKDKGGLPSNLLHDHYLVETNKYEDLDSDYYRAWAKEILVYPQKGGVFEKGKDVIDRDKTEGREWIFSKDSIPKEAIGKKNIALFVDPQEIEVTESKVIIHSKKVTICKDFLQESGWGKLDTKTALPMEVSKEELNKLQDKEKRYLYRISETGVRPVSRDVDFYGFWRVVVADRGANFRCGVAGVGTETAQKPKAEDKQIQPFLAKLQAGGRFKVPELTIETGKMKVGKTYNVTAEEVR